MKSKEEFKQFAQEHLLTELRHLEKHRQHLFIKVALLSLALFILAPLGLSDIAIPIIYLPGIITLIFLIFACDELFRKYPTNFKNSMTCKMLEFIDPSLTYSINDCISKQNFKKCNLFEDHIERYSGCDFIQGRIGKTDISISYIKADRSKNDNDSEIFRGLFIVIDMNKEFQGQTLIYPNTAEKFMGPLGKVLNSLVLQSGEHVTLENPDFNNEFVVYSTHQIEARYVLTPTLMEGILELKKNFRFAPCFSFTRSKVYIANRQISNTVNPNIFSNISDLNTCYEYFDELQKIIGIVDDLNLNTRIWTKE